MAKPDTFAKRRFFDKQVHMKEWKDGMSGANEKRVADAIEFWGYKLGIYFMRQHPVASSFVVDFAFVNEKVAIEVDGASHKRKEIRENDKKRDAFFYTNGWVVIRIPEEKFFGNSGSYYKNLVHEVVEERRKQYDGGFLYQTDVKEFNKEDF